MPLKIRNPEVDRLIDEITRITGESKTEAVRNALFERHQRLLASGVGPRNEARLVAFLEEEVWSKIPEHLLGQPMSKEDEEALLGVWRYRGVIFDR